MIDDIASYQVDERVQTDEMLQYFQIWQLSVQNKQAILTLLRDTDDPILTQKIKYTDFLVDEIKLYLNEKGLMLPSEY